MSMVDMDILNAVPESPAMNLQLRRIQTNLRAQSKLKGGGQTGQKFNSDSWQDYLPPAKFY